VADILEADVSAIVQQFVRHVVLHPQTLHNNKHNTAVPESLSSLITGFDIYRMMEQSLSRSREVIHTTKHSHSLHSVPPPIVESEMTLEVTKTELPLPMNAAVLEAVRYRLVDRYAKVPR
jgi:hypothetical protein